MERHRDDEYRQYVLWRRVCNSGKLNFGNASAFGTGRLTLHRARPSIIPDGAALTVSTGNPQTWNGDINFTGTTA